jgi:NosR/NirI family nitrous oxide reductase transcriptional regulator
VGEIIALILSLVLLTAILIYQHQLVRYRTVFVGLRWGFLAFTLLVLGFYSQGQLSVVNIFTVLQTWLHGFNIETFLIDPIIFILWIYVFATLFLWGRGVFCGWLCPFGALQEILSALARKLNIRQIRIKQPLHQRLWMLKYVILLVLVALSFYSLDKAEVASEVEPFKTAITLVFVRSWPFVLYAVLLLAMGLFVHKFYCRYVCPLGAGLAILGKLRLFSWLSRRDACGQPCQLCRHKCEIDAISPAGKINYDECIQCLECIVYYNADDLCPPQIAIAKRQRRRTPPTDLIPVVSQT